MVDVDQRGDRGRLLEDVEIFALDILDYRELGGFFAVDVDEETGDSREAEQLGGSQAAFTGDDLVELAVETADGQGLKDAAAADAVGETDYLVVLELLAGLSGVRDDFVGRDVVDATVLVALGGVGAFLFGALELAFSESLFGFQGALAFIELAAAAVETGAFGFEFSFFS